MAGHGHVETGGSKRIALLIGVLALCLALVETAAKSAQTDALSRNVEAANLWSFFQARTIRQTTLRAADEQAELTKFALTDPAARAALEAQQATWRATIARWEDDPKDREGRKQLAERASAAEHIRERSLSRYHMFEYGSAAFQVAIVVVSAAVVTGVPMLTVVGIVVALAGLVLGALGFVAPGLLHF